MSKRLRRKRLVGVVGLRKFSSKTQQTKRERWP
uniref:Ribosomal protein L32 n=1 Tax=Romanomermis culicivorax TaxID=13658 RepID=A0A915L615_ROMCU